MITLDVKPENSTSSSPLNLSSSDEEPKVSFSELLKGVNPKKDDKFVQNGAVVLVLESDQKVVKENFKSISLKGVNPKKDDKFVQNGVVSLSLDSDQKVVKENSKPIGKDRLISLLKNDEKVVNRDNELLELNPKITQNLSVKEVKTLIAGAKEYLKEKIFQSKGFKDAEIKELPKTLKGLSQLAQKIGIDVSKITIEEVQEKTIKPVLNVKQKIISKEQVLLKEEIKPQVQNDIKELKGISKEQVLLKEEIKPQVQNDIKELKNTPKGRVVIKEAEAKIIIKADNKNQVVQIAEDKKIEAPKQTVLAKETLLFKVQIPREHTTEQLVASKQFKVEEKTPKTRADETLKLLLRGEKPVQTNSILSTDFSVDTAKIIAPAATSEATSARAQQGKALEGLLHGESSESLNSSKTDGLSTLKSDSFELKLNEAKQMIKYLSNDVKTAIEDYKSPFTRVKVQLNPQKLGDVDLTIVQRGKNLHINLSSNSTAINTLSMNANELRTQLTNNGINNASLNFNSQDSSHSSTGEQEQHRQQQQADKEYSHFNNEEVNEEILSSLEIVVPNYA
ncbi:MAG: flagellar hook-length control protein FliK [Epsilonproteobacteria bacterium]|nr:MAG: flagellar hook-length control protein FliK [Campylobacterota bacterium]